MFWYVLLGFFAAFGILCALWSVLGCCLSGSALCHVKLTCQPGSELATIRRFCWLRESGLLHVQITVHSSRLSTAQRSWISEKYPYIHFSDEEIITGEECSKFDRNGNGDPAGHDRCCGVSEL